MIDNKSVKVLVQNLPIQIDPTTNDVISINKECLLSIFEDYNINKEESKVVIKTNLDGSSFAYGLITFEDYDQALSAVSEHNYSILNSNDEDTQILIKLLDPKILEALYSGTGKILIKNLPSNITSFDLFKSLSKYGKIIDCYVPLNNNVSYGYAIVQFLDPNDAVNLIFELNGSTFNDQEVEIVPFYQNKFSKVHEICTNWHELLVVSGTNNYHQIIFQTNTKKTDDEENITTPINYPLNALSLSISVYDSHSVNILNNSSAIAIGDNSYLQINNFKLSTFNQWNQIWIKQNQKKKYDIFLSAVCGSNYTLYLCQPQLSIDKPFLLLNTSDSSKVSKVFDSIDSIPISLYGGEFVSAAIDEEGSIIIIYNNEAILASLPNKKKAIQLACLNLTIIALSADGFLYEYSFLKMKNFVPIKFKENVKFSHISGSSEHFLAVTNDGKVYGRGNNEYGQLGPQKDEIMIENFFLLSFLSELKITAAYAGRYHSLFVDENGAVFSCGRNKFGELLLADETDVESVDTICETTVKKSATFCIAGKGLSVVFQYSKPPPFMPNSKIDSLYLKNYKKFVKKCQNGQVKEAKGAKEGKQNKDAGQTKQTKTKQQNKTIKNDAFDMFVNEIQSDFSKIFEEITEQNRILKQILDNDHNDQIIEMNREIEKVLKKKKVKKGGDDDDDEF